jgi:hypothetical protein
MSSNEPKKLEQREIEAVVTTFPSGIRDFLFVTREPDGSVRAVHPLDLLSLDRTAWLIERVKQRQPALGLNLALCRLLVPCLQYRGSGRHLVVENWSVEDVQGQTLPADVHTQLAHELSIEQAMEYRVVVGGTAPPPARCRNCSGTHKPACLFSRPDLMILKWAAWPKRCTYGLSRTALK